MTIPQEAARCGIELRPSARGSRPTSLSRALGVSDRAPGERIDWYLDGDTDADATPLRELKQLADEHCPGAYCIRNPIDFHTHLNAAR
jgi:hypothetical protein